MNNNTNIDIIIGKFLSGNCSSEEMAELEKWRKASDENKRVFDQSVLVWEKSAAWISPNQVSRDKLQIQQELNKNLTKQIGRERSRVMWTRIAAVLAFPIALALGWLLFTDNSQPEIVPQFCEVVAPKGHISRCVLPDGSEVWINTNSSIKYDANGFNTRQRNVEINGEAFFNVTKNQALPFEVKNQLARIVVTGTQFNVKAYAESKIFETVLEEGGINLHVGSEEHGQVVEVAPGEKVVFDASERELNVSKVDVELYSSWRDGQIIFKDATLNDLIRELERIYEIKFHLEDEALGEFRFRGMFSYNNNVIDALEKIKKTSGFDYHIENKEVWLKKKNK